MINKEKDLSLIILVLSLLKSSTGTAGHPDFFDDYFLIKELET
jgi:hypothetical protein